MSASSNSALQGRAHLRQTLKLNYSRFPFEGVLAVKTSDKEEEANVCQDPSRFSFAAMVKSISEQNLFIQTKQHVIPCHSTVGCLSTKLLEHVVYPYGRFRKSIYMFSRPRTILDKTLELKYVYMLASVFSCNCALTCIASAAAPL